MALIIFSPLGFLSSVSIQNLPFCLYGAVIGAGVLLIFDADMFNVHLLRLGVWSVFVQG